MQNGIKARLTRAFLIITVAFLVANIIIIGMHYSSVEAYRRISDKMILEYKLAETTEQMISAYDTFFKNIGEETKKEYRKNADEIENIFSQLDQVIVNKQSRSDYEGLKNTIRSVIEETDAGVNGILSGDISQTSLHYDEANRLYVFVKDNTSKLLTDELKDAQELQKSATQFYIVSFIIMGLVFIVAILQNVFYFTGFIKKLTYPLLRLTGLAGLIAGGRLDLSVEENLMQEKSEIGELSKSLNLMLISLKKNIENLNKAKNDLKSRNHELDELNKLLTGLKLKSEFLHIINHQLRTPISAMRGYLDFWKTGAVNKFSPEKQEEMKKNIIIASDQLASIVNNMIDALELEADGKEMKLDLATIDIKKFIEEIYEVDLKDSFEKKGIGFKLNAKNIPAIQSDRKYLTVIVSNLLDNALLYTLKGDVKVDVKIVKDKLEIRIKDTGIGLNEDDKIKLFQKFVRSKNAVKISPAGSGLGLYIVKRTTDILKGDIKAESEGTDKGTTFIINLPQKYENN
jgi:signal transduction histidine kinase